MRGKHIIFIIDICFYNHAYFNHCMKDDIYLAVWLKRCFNRSNLLRYFDLSHDLFCTTQSLKTTNDNQLKSIDMFQLMLL